MQQEQTGYPISAIFCGDCKRSDDGVYSALGQVVCFPFSSRPLRFNRSSRRVFPAPLPTGRVDFPHPADIVTLTSSFHKFVRYSCFTFNTR